MSAVSSGFGIGAAVTAAIRHTPNVISARDILTQISRIDSEKKNFLEKKRNLGYLILRGFFVGF